MKLRKIAGDIIHDDTTCANSAELLKSAMKAGIRNFCHADFRNANFSGADFRDADFSNADFSYADFRNADFSLAFFRNANFRLADFSYADFCDADFSLADFCGAEFRGADFSNADFRHADFSNADFRHADFRNANFSNADFRDANFSDADFRNADYRFVLGDGRLIKTMRAYWYVVRVGKTLCVGCEQHSVEKWFNFKDSEVSRMDKKALEWWEEWKPKLIAIGWL